MCIRDRVVNGRVSLFSAITSNTLFVFIIFLLGYFSFGFTLIYPLLFFKAFTAGISARLCVEIYGLYGVNYILVYILPVSLITLLLMALLSSQSFIFSYKSILGGDKNEVLKRLDVYKRQVKPSALYVNYCKIRKSVV